MKIKKNNKYLPEQKKIQMIQADLSSWYRCHCRSLPWRNTSDPYKIWVSEVMLQQTQVNTVIPYYETFLRQFPTVADLACTDQQQVLKMWEGLGYYARARNLHKAAGTVVQKHGNTMPCDFADLIKLPGVGDYIASAVISIAFSQPYAVVDGNVKRVLARIFLMAAPVNQSDSYKIYKQTAQHLLEKTDPGGHNQAVMELGALICKPAIPLCRQCPVQEWCQAFKKGRTEQFPVKIKKKPVPTHKIAAGVVFKNGKMLITRRKPDALLGGLWEFPGGRRKKGESAENACVREIREETGIAVKVIGRLALVKHAYTHFKIQMEVFICEYQSGDIQLNGPIDHQWITIDELNQYAFPKANLKFFDALRKAVKIPN